MPSRTLLLGRRRLLTSPVRCVGGVVMCMGKLTCWYLQDLKHMDAEVIFSKQLKQIEKEKKDKEIKLKVQEKKVR